MMAKNKYVQGDNRRPKGLIRGLNGIENTKSFLNLVDLVKSQKTKQLLFGWHAEEADESRQIFLGMMKLSSNDTEGFVGHQACGFKLDLPGGATCSSETPPRRRVGVGVGFNELGDGIEGSLLHKRELGGFAVLKVPKEETEIVGLMLQWLSETNK
jgi:hypothetical protein